MLRRTRLTIAGLAVASVIGAGAVAATIVTASAHERFAKATLRTADGTRVGTVAFERDRGSHHTEVTVRLRHADTLEAFHGFHIHANDVSTNGDGCIADPAQPASTWFVSADGHWKHDPTELHGHHAGDLPSVFVNADGTASIRFNVDKLKPAADHRPCGRSARWRGQLRQRPRWTRNGAVHARIRSSREDPGDRQRR